MSEQPAPNHWQLSVVQVSFVVNEEQVEPHFEQVFPFVGKTPFPHWGVEQVVVVVSQGVPPVNFRMQTAGEVVQLSPNETEQLAWSL